MRGFESHRPQTLFFGTTSRDRSRLLDASVSTLSLRVEADFSRLTWRLLSRSCVELQEAVACRRHRTARRIVNALGARRFVRDSLSPKPVAPYAAFICVPWAGAPTAAPRAHYGGAELLPTGTSILRLPSGQVSASGVNGTLPTGPTSVRHPSGQGGVLYHAKTTTTTKGGVRFL